MIKRKWFDGFRTNGNYLVEWFFCPINEYGPDMNYYRIYSKLSNKNILELFIKDDINARKVFKCDSIKI